MFCDQPVVHRVFRETIVIVDRALNSSQEVPPLLQDRKKIAAGGELDAVTFRFEVDNLGDRIGTGPNDDDEFAAGPVLERVE